MLILLLLLLTIYLARLEISKSHTLSPPASHKIFFLFLQLELDRSVPVLAVAHFYEASSEKCIVLGWRCCRGDYLRKNIFAKPVRLPRLPSLFYTYIFYKHEWRECKVFPRFSLKYQCTRLLLEDYRQKARKRKKWKVGKEASTAKEKRKADSQNEISHFVPLFFSRFVHNSVVVIESRCWRVCYVCVLSFFLCS